MWLKLKCHQNRNVAKLTCHQNWNVNENWNVNKTKMSPKLKCHKNWNVTKTEMSQKVKLLDLYFWTIGMLMVFTKMYANVQVTFLFSNFLLNDLIPPKHMIYQLPSIIQCIMHSIHYTVLILEHPRGKRIVGGGKGGEAKLRKAKWAQRPESPKLPSSMLGACINPTHLGALAFITTCLLWRVFSFCF